MIIRKVLLPLLTVAAVLSSATVSHASVANRLTPTPEDPCPFGTVHVSIASGPLQMSSSDPAPTLNIRLMCYNSTLRRLTPIPAGQAINLEVLGVWATLEAALGDDTLRNENTSWPYDNATANASYQTFTTASGQYTMPAAGWNKLKNVGKPDTWGVLYWHTMVCHRWPGDTEVSGCIINEPTKLLFIDHI
ncbi:hypothetical protein AB0F17_04855 [Nonomuraea sp. NPDC026600]|uniref:hypothetical protein n=1 Tax=Nonomuraea sp. NPDC026600 TaxID=3155363 RepID=UPI003400B880